MEKRIPANNSGQKIIRPGDYETNSADKPSFTSDPPKTNQKE